MQDEFEDAMALYILTLKTCTVYICQCTQAVSFRSVKIQLNYACTDFFCTSAKWQFIKILKSRYIHSDYHKLGVQIICDNCYGHHSNNVGHVQLVGLLFELCFFGLMIDRLPYSHAEGEGLGTWHFEKYL